MSEKPKKSSITHVKPEPYRRGELRKAVDAVYAYPQQGKLTLVGRKAFNLLLANAMDQGADREWYEIEIGELAKDIRYDSNDIKRLESTLNEMQRTLLKWDVLETINDQEIPIRDSVQLLGAVRLIGGLTEDGKRSPIARQVRYKFDERVKQRLLVPEVYARINLQLQATIKSAYTLALYEQLIRYRGNNGSDGWNYTVKLPWREWRNLILGGDYSAGYENYKYFGRDVLAKSLKELNERVLDYEFELLVFKDGRSISDLQFRLRERAQGSLSLASDDPLIDTAGISKRLEAFELKKTEISKLLRVNDLLLLEEAADETEARLRRGDLNPIRNKPAYFLNALNRVKDYARTGAPSDASHEVVSKTVEADIDYQAASQGTERAVAQQAEMGRTWADIEADLNALPEEIQTEIIDAFIDAETNRAVLAAYAKHGFKSPMVRVAFTPWFEKAMREKAGR
ncbi:hypothetical protein TMEC54S_00235 [Thauera mechernichensis]|uniref:replication initiation protein n=1 Tax=Thauera sp. 27 TaxID=305700 RepID=UPI0012F85578|nr:replication initiation protein [Thauera sp. 27]